MPSLHHLNVRQIWWRGSRACVFTAVTQHPDVHHLPSGQVLFPPSVTGSRAGKMREKFVANLKVSEWVCPILLSPPQKLQVPFLLLQPSAPSGPHHHHTDSRLIVQTVACIQNRQRIRDQSGRRKKVRKPQAFASFQRICMFLLHMTFSLSLSCRCCTIAAGTAGHSSPGTGVRLLRQCHHFLCHCIAIFVSQVSFVRRGKSFLPNRYFCAPSCGKIFTPEAGPAAPHSL